MAFSLSFCHALYGPIGCLSGQVRDHESIEKEREREREKESASQALCTLARRFIRRGRHARLVSRRILAYVAADTHFPALSFALAPTPNAFFGGLAGADSFSDYHKYVNLLLRLLTFHVVHTWTLATSLRVFC